MEFLPIKEHIETPNDKITTFFVFYQQKNTTLQKVKI